MHCYVLLIFMQINKTLQNETVREKTISSIESFWEVIMGFLVTLKLAPT